MAERAATEVATAPGNDLPAHEATYERFVHLVIIGCAHVANIVIGLAIGAVTGHWLVAFAVFVVATVLAVHGFLTGARGPSAGMVVVSLLALALSSGG
jgi:Bacterial aa3 type cytochrome c oxidase subunit IV